MGIDKVAWFQWILVCFERVESLEDTEWWEGGEEVKRAVFLLMLEA